MALFYLPTFINSLIKRISVENENDLKEDKYIIQDVDLKREDISYDLENNVLVDSYQVKNRQNLDIKTMTVLLISGSLSMSFYFLYVSNSYRFIDYYKNN
jgi:hypothetical protein